MPRRCSICRHDEVELIDRELLAGATYRDIAKRFHVGASSVHRHMASHLAGATGRALRARDDGRADRVLADLEALTREARELKSKAELTGDIRTALAAVRELVRIIELMARLGSDIGQGETSVNVTLSAEWSVVLMTLSDYPTARAAVARALEEVR